MKQGFKTRILLKMLVKTDFEFKRNVFQINRFYHFVGKSVKHKKKRISFFTDFVIVLKVYFYVYTVYRRKEKTLNSHKLKDFSSQKLIFLAHPYSKLCKTTKNNADYSYF